MRERQKTIQTEGEKQGQSESERERETDRQTHRETNERHGERKRTKPRRDKYSGSPRDRQVVVSQSKWKKRDRRTNRGRREKETVGGVGEAVSRADRRVDKRDHETDRI